jgi:NADPH-dependent 2,4-dienoyl-CoA reductase/sulfur reductase-like enzyme
MNSNIYAISKTGRKIRLTGERWSHIIESHDYMAGNKDLVLETLEDPDIIVDDEEDALIAVKHYLKTSIGEKDVAVVYKESEYDGFVITTFMTSKPEKIIKKGVIWKKDLT